jgi:hypothetical protein
VEIMSPDSGVTVLAEGTVNLEAYAYDIDTGSMQADDLSWHSSLDGLLGDGSQRTVTGLSVGAHTIIFRADDGRGGVATDSVQVEVVNDPSLLRRHAVYLPILLRDFSATDATPTPTATGAPTGTPTATATAPATATPTPTPTPTPTATPSGADVLVSAGATWTYLDDGSDQGTAWHDPGFDDSAWAVGPAQLGYGDDDEATEVSYGPDPDDKHITTYFRHTFQVDDASMVGGLRLRLLRDDGALVYLNGTLVRRSNMPGGAIDDQTLASTCVWGSDEGAFWEVDIGAEHLVSGSNVIAVEVHQCDPGSSDISFDLELSRSTADALDVSLHDEKACVPSGSAVRLTTQWYVDTPDLADDWLDALNLTVEVDGAALSDVAEYWGTVEALADIDEDGDMDYVTRWAYPIGTLGGGAHTVESHFSLAYPITDGFDFDEDGEPDEFSGSWDYALVLQVGGCVVSLQDQEKCVPSGSPVRLTTHWYAATAALAQDYLDALDLTVEVDGESLSEVPDHWSAAEPCGDFDEDGETDYVTRWAYPVKDLDDGEHTVDAHFSLAHPITDGFDLDGDGVPDEYTGSWDRTLTLQVGGCLAANRNEANPLSSERKPRPDPVGAQWVYVGALADALAGEHAAIESYLPVRLRW